MAQDLCELLSAAPREHFIRRTCETMMVYAVAGEEGLARARSRDIEGREVTFLWSELQEAEKRAACIAENPRIKELPLGEVLTTLLPALAEHNRRVGVDWSAGPDEPELEPLQLAACLREGVVTAFVERAVTTCSVWVLSGMFGPAMMVSRVHHEGSMLPCWSVRERAEMRIEGPWEEMVLSEIPLKRFVEVTLPGLSETGALVCPDNILGAQTLEIAPDVLAKRLVSGG